MGGGAAVCAEWILTIDSGTRELRLAVVLYGGVSLAIYMHGTAKELHRLVKGSAVSAAGAGRRFTPSEDVYARLLDELEKRDPDHVRTRVVVDVIAGTSAGGINGVYLAKALAHNLSQEALRDLWLRRGDIKELLRLRGLPKWLRVPVVLARAVKKPPLDGDAIARWMFDALRDMDTDGRIPGDLETLLPQDGELELFVTTTDVSGYRRDLLISDPKLIHDHTHRHVFTFRYGGDQDDFSPDENAGLAFAARATMSFPGAFPPVSVPAFERLLACEGGDASRLGRRFRVYGLSRADPSLTHFIDGGVLDNRPFLHAIRAIKRRSAESEVDRRLLYLEPDPGRPVAPAVTAAAAPSPLATVLAAVSGIPRKEPILDDILEVGRHNERVRRIRDIIKMQFAPIRDEVEKLVGADLGRLAEMPKERDIKTWTGNIETAARESAGLAYATYIRSKVSGVIDRYARAICRRSDYPDDCNQAAFVRAVLREWARTRLFTERDGRPVTADDHVEFLRTFDLDYGARRLRFVIDALSWWYRDVGKPGYPTRAQLDEGKAALWELRRELVDAMWGRGLTDLTDEMLACFQQKPIDDWVDENKGPEAYAAANADALERLEREFGRALDRALDGFGGRLLERVDAITRSWSPERRRDLLVRHLGFPFWDILLYPIQSIADAGERDAIDVVRMSPFDTHLLPPLDPNKHKLDGVRMMHFGAFFDRSGRENDYLWGRLDGAERLIGLLLPGDENAEHRTRWCREAFGAIVREEREALPNATALLEHADRFGSERPDDADSRLLA